MVYLHCRIHENIGIPNGGHMPHSRTVGKGNVSITIDSFTKIGHYTGVSANYDIFVNKISRLRCIASMVSSTDKTSSNINRGNSKQHTDRQAISSVRRTITPGDRTPRNFQRRSLGSIDRHYHIYLDVEITIFLGET